MDEQQRTVVKAELIKITEELAASSQSSDSANASVPAPPAPKRKTAFDMLLGEEEETADNTIEDELAQQHVIAIHYTGGNKMSSISLIWPK